MDSTDHSTVHLTVEQAASHAQLSVKTIRRMIRRGQLATGRAGQAYVVELPELERALQARGASRDSPPVQSSALVQAMASSMATPELLRSVVQDAVRAELGPLLAELDRTRVQGDELAEQLRALLAPRQVPWWRRWFR